MIRNRDDLERKCRDVLRAVQGDEDDETPASFVERELALTLDHIRRVRQQDRHFRRGLLERECDIETQIMNIRPSYYRYIPHRWVEQSKMVIRLTAALTAVETQRNRLIVDYDKRMQALHDRLLQLLNMHAQLHQDHGNSEDTS